MPKNLIITGGIFHPFDESSQALADALLEIGVESEITEDVDGGIASLAQGTYALVTINALRWGMMTADKYQPYRADFAYSTPQASRDGLVAFVKGGGGLLGLHTASICFDDWPEWGNVLGGHWIWGRSHHPPLGMVSAQATQQEHAVSAGIPPFELVDEIYHDMELQPDVVPLLVGETPAGTGPQPIVWAREFDQGRVVYDALGHDAPSVNQPEHRRLLQQAAQWLISE